MKKIIKDLLFGFLIIVVTLIVEFLITLPFGEIPEGDRAGWASLINMELLLTSAPAALVTYAFTGLLKTSSKGEAIRRAIIWTCLLALYYVLIGIGNGNLDLIYGAIGIYVLLLCAFAGPIIYLRVKRLK